MGKPSGFYFIIHPSERRIETVEKTKVQTWRNKLRVWEKHALSSFINRFLSRSTSSLSTERTCQYSTETEQQGHIPTLRKRGRGSQLDPWTMLSSTALVVFPMLDKRKKSYAIAIFVRMGQWAVYLCANIAGSSFVVRWICCRDLEPYGASLRGSTMYAVQNPISRLGWQLVG